MPSDPSAPQGEDPRVEAYAREMRLLISRVRFDSSIPAEPKPILQRFYDRLREDGETLRRENAKLRESNTILNRRATKAEAIVAQRVEEQERKGKSLGRSLANAGYYLLKAENLRFREALEAFAEHDCTYGDNCPTGARHGTCTGCDARAALDPSTTGTK